MAQRPMQRIRHQAEITARLERWGKRKRIRNQAARRPFHHGELCRLGDVLAKNQARAQRLPKVQSA